MDAPRLRTWTLGCRVNQYETEFVRQSLLTAGYRDAVPHEEADLCVINTCTVTAEGDAKSRQIIRQMAKKNPLARIIVMGCYATRDPEEVSRLHGVSEVVTDKRRLPDLLQRLGVGEIADGISSFPGRRRAFVKVQDGCYLRCSFCIIPHVRPEPSSRSPEQIIAEVCRLVDAGHREVVLTGIHLGHYGVDQARGRAREEWVRLADLLRRLALMPGDFRIRLSSIEATEVPRRLLDVMAEFPNRICPHLHICLQSGSDRVLRRMRRRWGVQRIVDRCRLAQQILDTPALTTDVIVGFPGETEEDFAATCRAMREVGFSKVHVFPFSPRQGTEAAAMTDQIPRELIHDRSARLQELSAGLRDDFARGLKGRVLQVMAEARQGKDAQHLLGTACRYLTVEFPQNLAKPGEFINLVAGEIEAGVVAGAVPRD